MSLPECKMPRVPDRTIVVRTVQQAGGLDMVTAGGFRRGSLAKEKKLRVKRVTDTCWATREVTKGFSAIPTATHSVSAGVNPQEGTAACCCLRTPGQPQAVIQPP